MSRQQPGVWGVGFPKESSWFWDLCANPVAFGRTRVRIDGKPFVLRNGILRDVSISAGAQRQTRYVFGFKWGRRETFERPASLQRMRTWLVARYGNVCGSRWWKDHGERPIFLDAGCGAGMSAFELFRPVLKRIRYVGVDLSSAVDVARGRLQTAGAEGVFLQSSVNGLPFRRGVFDLIFSEGVLHHTESTEKAMKSLAPLLKKGGRFLFYVYRKKGPVREFTDDFVREKLRALPPAEAWRAMEPLTRLGIELGKLNARIQIPRAIKLLDIPAGRIDVQRLFYWHVAKAFYDPSLTFEEMNHINYDWYAPPFAHRHRIEEIRRWCVDAQLAVERERVEPSGITVIARKL